MKLKIRPYLIALIKENIAFISGLILALILIIFLFIMTITKIINNDEKIKALKEEVENLKKKQALIETQIDEKKLEQYVRILNTLLPQQEDYFSIIAALEKISQTTGFKISSYQIVLADTRKQMTKIMVTGQGNREDFLNFLKNYNFAGGRLVTTEEIAFSEIDQANSLIELNFYNQGGIELSSNIILSDYDLPDIATYLSKFERILEKTTFSLVNEGQTTKESESYQKKTNPF